MQKFRYGFIPWWEEDYEKFTYHYQTMEEDVKREAKTILAECGREELLSPAGKLGLTLFHLLVWHNFYDEVSEMLRDGRITDADITDRSGHGITPFLLACPRFEELDNDSDLPERSVEQRAGIARLLTGPGPIL